MVFLINESNSAKQLPVSVIARAVKSPAAYTSKILQKLNHAKLILSTKGHLGGYYILDERKNEIFLRDVIKVIDGEQIFSVCVLGFPKCSDSKPCALHHTFKHLRDDLRNKIAVTKIIDLMLENP
ncbi:MAG: Rrf2 family transcriptional regulator [Bacteroidetes bacterium]|nr:Rrf2 family transcriptional regulator [Bacteroidota bacterium]